MIPGLINSEDLMATIEPYDQTKEYLGPLVYGGSRLTVMGPMGQGKTSLLMEMAGAIVKGRDFLGFTGRGGLRVAYINTEMPKEQITQALRDANAGDPRLDVINRRFKFDTTPDDQRLIFKIAQTYQAVFIDPWYQFVEKPQEDYTLAGRTAELFTRLQMACPETAFVIGAHSHEPAGKQPLSLANIMGYKNYHWNADTILIMQRVARDTSKLGWEKVRCAEFDRYDVKLKEKWTVQWERGKGFTRIDKPETASDVLLETLTRQWMTKQEIIEATGFGHTAVERALVALAAEGLVETSGGVTGGRGRVKFWRLTDPDQEAFDLAV